MGDVSAEPTMEEILSSIKRVIEESETASPAARPRRSSARTVSSPPPFEKAEVEEDGVLELSERAPFSTAAPREDVQATLAPEAQPLRTEAILSATTAQASRGPLEALSRLVVKPEVAGSDSLEGLVREMLRPMLRDWLDAQLPSIVETMVAKEIARISDRTL